MPIRIAAPAAWAIPILAALALAGCTPTPAPTLAPETTPAAPAAPSATPSSPPGTATNARGATTPIEAVDAYALCKAQTMVYYPGDFAKVQFASFESSPVLLRDDGRWFVYIEAHDENREPSLVDASASNCIVGGTIGAPDWLTFGVMSRDVATEVIANYNAAPRGD
ncbi:hypothetical protein [Agromyces sp. Soil535]|uniref:hypothetical protein n=1 Tax=Agromyces sp. Soil535 TaxID=1736390 RepID=UPI0006FE2353|nr:hypothetical protein [Agromyces sp. Soil535]KRE22903.1 hypothetical protein ASG80_08445 [Agromyces sp. Soil535]